MSRSKRGASRPIGINKADSNHETPFHLPARLSSCVFRCEACGAQFRPDFFRKRSEPLVPIKPLTTPPDHPGRAIPTAAHEQCLSCGSTILIPLPVETMSARCALYGDEAFREVGSRSMVTYSLVGADSRVIETQGQALSRIKRALEPARDPSSWVFHMLELWSGQKRKKHPVYSAWNDDKCRLAHELLFSVFTSDEPFFVYNIVCCGHPRTIDRTKRQAYGSLLMLLIDDLTAARAQPQVYFDSERPGPGDTIVHGWAKAIVSESRYRLLHAFIARGIEIPEPRFVPPASHPCLELADFVSFVVARYYHDKWRESKPTLDPAKLGSVRYVGFEPTGDMVWLNSVGYPWEAFNTVRSTAVQLTRD